MIVGVGVVRLVVVGLGGMKMGDGVGGRMGRVWLGGVGVVRYVRGLNYLCGGGSGEGV